MILACPPKCNEGESGLQDRTLIKCPVDILVRGQHAAGIYEVALTINIEFNSNKPFTPISRLAFTFLSALQKLDFRIFSTLTSLNQYFTMRM